MKRFLLLLFLPLTSFAWTVSVGTWVCNPDASVSVPISIDDAAGLAYAAVRINYDPQVLICLRVEKGGLDAAFDGDFLVSDAEEGTLSVARFRASEGVTPSGGGVLVRAVFAVRPGTARQYSDLAIADIRLGDETGVRDMALAGSIVPSAGMVRIFPENGSATRLEGPQTIAAGTCLGTLTLSDGDAIQASLSGSPIIVSGETAAPAPIPVRPPEGGWTTGSYPLLKTATRSLSFVSATDGTTPLSVEETEADGLRLYSLHVDTGNVPEVLAADNGEPLGTAATAYVRGLFAGEEGIVRIEVSGGEQNVLAASALGIKPAESRSGNVIQATFASPTIEIINYDAANGIMQVRVNPGEGNTIGTDLVKGVVRLCGGASPDELGCLLTIVPAVDSETYLQPETKGEFNLANAKLDFGRSAFFRLAIVVPRE